jgi:hypothetical protein
MFIAKLISILVVACSFASGLCSIDAFKDIWEINYRINWNGVQLYAGKYDEKLRVSYNNAPIHSVIIYTSMDSTFSGRYSIKNPNDIISCCLFKDPCGQFLSACEGVNRVSFVIFQNRNYFVAFADYQANCHVSPLATSNVIYCDTKVTSFLFDNNLNIIKRKDLEGIPNPLSLSPGLLPHTSYTTLYQSLNVTIMTRPFWKYYNLTPGAHTPNNIRVDSLEVLKITLDDKSQTFNVEYTHQKLSTGVYSSKLNKYHRVISSQQKEKNFNLLGKKVKNSTIKNAITKEFIYESCIR